jgi:hypothetical protein
MIQNFLEWVKYPVTSDGDVVDWFAGFVFLLTLAFLWRLGVVKKITGE